MPRRASQTSISLFAFQDIIISVSGIMILIVLLLAIQLTDSTDESGKQYQETARELREQLKEVTSQIDEVSRELEDTDGLVRLATENPTGQLDKAIASEERHIAKSENQLDNLKGTSEELTQSEQASEKTQQKSEELQEELKELRSEILTLSETLKKIQQGNAGTYVSPRGIDPKRAWICDVSNKQLLMIPLKGKAAGHRLAWNGDTETAMQVLRQWLRSTSPQPDYVLFLIRPSGLAFDEAVNFKVPSLGLQFGIELIADDHTVLRGDDDGP